MTDIPASLDELDQDDKGRLIVKASHRNPVDIADEVAAYILTGNDPPQLFSMSPAAVTLKNGALTPLDTDGWLLYVARRVTFIVPSRNGTQTVAPPAAVMKLIPPVVIPELPALDGIVTTPYLDRDGNVVAADGYNQRTRLVLHSGGFTAPAVSAIPSEEDVAQAVKLLTEEWLGDFPFASACRQGQRHRGAADDDGPDVLRPGAAVRVRRLHRRLRKGPAGHHDLPDRDR